MSTQPITPDVQENDPVPQSNLGAAMSTVQGSNGPTQVNTANPDFNQQPNQPSVSSAPQPTSRLFQILSAVARVGAVGVAAGAAPQKGRSSFAGGLGAGATGELEDQANQQAIKFKSFEDSVRAAQLHNDDLRLQNQTEAQQIANAKEWRDRHDWLEDKGYDDTTIPNHGDSVVNHMQAMTASNGSVAVTPGSSINPDGNTIHIPSDTQETRDAQKKLYDTFSPAYGMGSRDANQDFVPGKQVDILQHLMQGKNPDGSPINHDKLPGMIASYQTQRDTLAQKGSTSADVLKQLDNTIGILKAQQDYLDKHAADVKQQTKAAELAAETTPENITGQAKLAGAKANAELPAKQALQDSAAGNKQQAAGSVVGFDPQTKERVVVNANDPRASSLTQSGKVSSTQLDNWGTSQNQFANVQLAVSRYDQAAREFAKSGKGSDIVGINSALNKSGVGDVKIGEYGVSVPGFTSLAEASSRVANSAAFKALSPAGQDLVDKYFRMMSSIPEYQKASTGIGRTNKEMLDLELKNIPDPTMPPSVISNRLSSFQEALSSNASRVPHIQGIPHYKDVQQHYQPQSQQTPQRQTSLGGSNLGNAVGSAMDVVNSLQRR